MIVGQSLCGKTTCWKYLKKGMNILHKSHPKKWPAVKEEVLNPKSVSVNELFGFFD